jgi:hypothetical protein
MESDTKTPYLNTGTNSKHRHTLMMVLGCIIPLLLLGILLLCPIMHLVMMKNMKYGTQNPECQIDENKKEGLT